jgi:hypothetical protein
MQSLLNEISQKIVERKENSVAFHQRKLKKLIILDKRTVSNALSKNQKINISEKLNILK